MSMNKPLIAGGVAVIALAAGWAGATVMTQRAIEARIAEGITSLDPSLPFRLAGWRTQSAFRRLSGEADLVMHSDCPGGSVPDTSLGHLRYQVDVGANPFGAARVHVEFVLQPKEGVTPGTSAADKPILTAVADGTIDGRGNVDETVAITPNEALVPKDQLRIDPMTVTARRDGEATHTRFVLPGIHARGPNGKAIEVRTISGDFENPGADRDVGSARLGIDEITAGDVAFRGLRIEVRQTKAQDVLTGQLTYRLASGNVPGKALKDLALALSYTGLRSADLRRLSRAADARCRRADAVTPEDLAALQAAAVPLLRHGFTLSVDKLGGSIGNGTLDAATKIEVLPTPGAEPMTTARMLTVAGHLHVTGDDLMPADIEPLVRQRLVVPEGNGMRSEFALAGGRVTLNGQPGELPPLQLMLERLDAMLARLPAEAAAPAGPAASGSATGS